MKYRYDIHTGVTKIKTKIAYALTGLGLVLGGSGLSLGLLGTAHAAACIPTGFIRDLMNLTARQVGGSVTGDLDATGCNIGVYYDANHKGTVNHANIHGSNYFGVVVDGGQGNVKVDITNSSIHNIGETPFNGTQHGNAIYYYGQGTSGTVKGEVQRNTVSQYQKGGIIINGEKANVEVHDNTVNGLGPVDFIAQNGIQISRGAQGSVHNNTVTGNAYTGDNWASSAGILVYGGAGDPLVTGVSVHNNTLIGNDVGVFVADYNSDASAGPSTPTKISVHNNEISDSAVTNKSGWCDGVPAHGCGAERGYQAGISDSGNRDSIHNNKISGAGYALRDDTTAVVFPIDKSAPYSINPDVHNNTYNGNPYP